MSSLMAMICVATLPLASTEPRPKMVELPGLSSSLVYLYGRKGGTWGGVMCECRYHCR